MFFTERRDTVIGRHSALPPGISLICRNKAEGEANEKLRPAECPVPLERVDLCTFQFRARFGHVTSVRSTQVLIHQFLSSFERVHAKSLSTEYSERCIKVPVASFCVLLYLFPFISKPWCGSLLWGRLSPYSRSSDGNCFCSLSFLQLIYCSRRVTFCFASFVRFADSNKPRIYAHVRVCFVHVLWCDCPGWQCPRWLSRCIRTSKGDSTQLDRTVASWGYLVWLSHWQSLVKHSLEVNYFQGVYLSVDDFVDIIVPGSANSIPAVSGGSMLLVWSIVWCPAFSIKLHCKIPQAPLLCLCVASLHLEWESETIQKSLKSPLIPSGLWRRWPWSALHTCFGFGFAASSLRWAIFLILSILFHESLVQGLLSKGRPLVKLAFWERGGHQLGFG